MGSYAGSQNARSKITEADVVVMRQLRMEGEEHADIGERFGLSASTTQKIVAGITWRHVPMPDGEMIADRLLRSGKVFNAHRGEWGEITEETDTTVRIQWLGGSVVEYRREYVASRFQRIIRAYDVPSAPYDKRDHPNAVRGEFNSPVPPDLYGRVMT